ncbi:ATP-binding cassette domain-containing protein [Streptomyces pratensis]|uniref:ATP-binding cassette domain-containing protein n=1 Tax=Streptomyces pratensis TaxID=1169025 RepID=UPI0030170FE9
MEGGAVSAGGPVLDVRDVHKSYRRRPVLRGTLEVRPGQLVGVVGENGAGKSTLSRVPRGEARWAWLLSDGGEPRNWMLVLAPLLGWRADSWAGLGWGAFAALFTAVGPTLVLHFGESRRYWGDRRMRRRQDRLMAAPGVMACVLTATALLYAGGAPAEVTALVTAMASVLLALLAVTFFWKVSVHSAVASGALAILVTAFGPWALAPAPVIMLIGWSRVRLRCHTTGQVLAGTLIGAAVGAPLYTLLG